MLNWFGRYIFAATAVAPIALAYSWAAFLQSRYMVAVALLVAAPLLVLLCHLQITNAIKTFERATITPKAAESTDRESVALIVLYLIPLFTYKFTDLQWNVIIPCMALLAAIFSTGYNFYFSPLLGLLKWHSYKITDQAGITYVIITKRELRSALKQFEVVQLTEYLLLDVPMKDFG